MRWSPMMTSSSSGGDGPAPGTVSLGILGLKWLRSATLVPAFAISWALGAWIFAPRRRALGAWTTREGAPFGKSPRGGVPNGPTRREGRHTALPHAPRGLLRLDLPAPTAGPVARSRLPAGI